MTIYALKGPSLADYKDQDELQKIQQFLSDSIKNGVSRFGWSYINTADLTKLKDKRWQEMSKEEQDCWAKANFLLGIKEGDWVVHINLPYWGYCLAGKVIETYSFEHNGNDFGDYRHLLKLDKNTIVEFERNDDGVLPIISSRLKLQGRYWTIQYVDEFLQTLENVKAKTLGKKEDESVGIFYLKRELSPLFKNITEKIQKTHPASNLENLIAEVFRKLPNVVDVREHGQHKGWGTDSGADLIVTYKSGLPVSNLEKEEKLVVQVKSYTGQHWETNAVEQIETAIKEFQANAGLIITTAESTDNLEKAIENLSNKLSKPEQDGGLNKPIPIGLIAGEEVAKFVLKYGGQLIL
jgi:bifunctional DNA-binding transcriptional regulator/antitoxin component of YhaV-PrlF toxin-antitoxin module